MITVRKADERGHFDFGWLDTYHTFSFGDYHDEAHMGFRALRVINDDRVQAGMGFGKHGHRDMEIVTYVLEGELEHKDSLGTGSVIRPGDVQRMSAGKGVLHSEFNPSKVNRLHLLQIWILPEKSGIEPSYEEKRFEAADKRGKLRLVASRDGRDGSVTIHQDASIYATLLARGDELRHPLARGRHAWVHVATGGATVNGKRLSAGDAVALSGEPEAVLRGEGDAEVLLFDLA